MMVQNYNNDEIENSFLSQIRKVESMKKVLDTLDVSWNQFLTSVDDDVSWKKSPHLAQMGTQISDIVSTAWHL